MKLNESKMSNFMTAPHVPQESAYLGDDIYFPEDIVCEQIENSTKSIQEPLERQIEAIKSIADSAAKQSKIAEENSKSSTRFSRISIVLSVIAIIVSIAAIVTPILYGQLQP